MWSNNKGCVDLYPLQTKNEEELLYNFWEWHYLFVCLFICLLKYFRHTVTLRVFIFGYSMTSSAVVYVSAGCLVFNSASAVIHIFFFFVRNKPESSFGAHHILSDFNYFCFVRQQRKLFFATFTHYLVKGIKK